MSEQHQADAYDAAQPESQAGHDVRSSLDRAFEQFLLERGDEREGLTARQQLWAAFKAGADWSLAELRSVIDTTQVQP